MTCNSKRKLVLIFEHSVRTSKRTESTSITKINQIMPYMEIIVFFPENRMGEKNTLCGQIQSY
jgi:hypothetical protein